MKLGKSTREFFRYIIILLPVGLMLLYAWGGFDFYENPPSDLLGNQWQLIMLALNGIHILSALIFLLSGSAGLYLFKRGLSKLRKAGKPYKTLPGMSGIMKSYEAERMKTQWIFIGSIITAVFYWVSFLGLIEATDMKLIRMIIHLIAGVIGLIVSYLALTISALAIPRFRPFGLLDTYEPNEQLLFLDNILTDLIESNLDPLTHNYLDEYNATLLAAVDDKEMFYQAKEKLYLLNVLEAEMPNTLTDQMVEEELAELFGPEDIKRIINHEDFSFKQLQTLVKKIAKIVPQFFKVVSRLFLNLDENLSSFKAQELYLDIGYPILATGVTPLFIFLFNNSDDYQKSMRRINLKVETTAFHPKIIEMEVNLDMNGGFKIESEQLPITAPGDNEDLLNTMSKVLEIGDGVLLLLRPYRFGVASIIRVTVEDENGHLIAGKTLTVHTKQKLIDKYIGKLFGSK